jgi:hypothetical protein
MAVENKVRVGTEAVNTNSLPKWRAAGVTTATHRNYSKEELDVASLKYDAIESKLRVTATLNDVFVQSLSEVNFRPEDGKMTLPDQMTMKITAPSGSNTIKIPFTDPISGPGRAGQERQSGFEVGRSLRYMTFGWNEESQAVMVTKWGKEYSDLQAHLGLFDRAQPDLSKWFLEQTGRQFREASLRVRSRELCKDTGLVQAWNPNIFVANTDPNNQPAYSSTIATHADNIVAAMQAAASSDVGTNAQFSIEFMDALLDYAMITKRIRPINVGGEDRYLLVLPSNQLSKVTSLVGQLGQLWVDSRGLTDMEMKYTGILGRYKELLVVSDSRYATLDVNYGTKAIVPQYVEPGNADGRNRRAYAANNTIWSVGGLYGAGAFGDWSVRDLHFEEEPQEYGKEVGIGAFRERGIQLGLLQSDATTAGLPNNVENLGSVALLFTNTATMQVK